MTDFFQKGHHHHAAQPAASARRSARGRTANVCSATPHGVGVALFVLGANCVLWLGYPQVSWLWWNVAGCLVALGVGLIGAGMSVTLPKVLPVRGDVVRLVTMAAGILAACVPFQALAA